MSKPAGKGLKEGNVAVDKYTHNIGKMSNTLTDVRRANSENSFNTMTVHMVT
jgi:hypothetical protein